MIAEPSSGAADRGLEKLGFENMPITNFLKNKHQLHLQKIRDASGRKTCSYSSTNANSFCTRQLRHKITNTAVEDVDRYEICGWRFGYSWSVVWLKYLSTQ